MTSYGVFDALHILFWKLKLFNKFEFSSQRPASHWNAGHNAERCPQHLITDLYMRCVRVQHSWLRRLA